MIENSKLTHDRLFDELIEEICRQIEIGEPIDLEGLATSYPELADQLRLVYPTLLAINTLDHSCELGSGIHDRAAFSAEKIGDFQILRQIGRGGMGVVYEAQQLSIPRKVALKVLPLAALVDHRALQRFKNEVAAIATLEHPHIVSVYAIGEDRGIHYYAMQLIHGQSLAAVIRELRTRADQDKSLSGEVLNQVVSDMEDVALNEVPSPRVSRGEGGPPTVHRMRGGELKPNQPLTLPSPREARGEGTERAGMRSAEAAEPILVPSPPRDHGSNSSVPSPPLGGRGQGEGASDISDRQLSSQTAEHRHPNDSRDINHDPADETQSETVARGRSSTVRRVGDQTYFRNVVRLILQASDALQHAHDHGIVHRDVKPGNLLLDTHGSLFVTDFGLARIETGAGVTMTGDVMGTLRYMSPEQILGKRIVIDHRTDIYSLGATLYELLTLQPIWSGDERAELIRQISFEEPVPPRKINPAIPNDLETIVLKSITKSPDDRYDSAQAFADDLQSYLELKPIVARRPTLVQRLNKWTRRNPAIVWSSVAILTVVVASLALGVIGLVTSNRMISEREKAKQNALERAEEQTTLAVKAQNDALLERDRADLKASIANAFNDFIDKDLFGNADPNVEPDRDLKVSVVLDRALSAIGNRFSDQPMVEAEIRTMIGRTLGSLARFDESVQQLNLARQIYVQNDKTDTREALQVDFYLCWRLCNQGQYQESLKAFQELFGRCRSILGDLDVLTLQASNGAAEVLGKLGRHSEAELAFRELISNQERALGPQHVETLLSKRGLATLTCEQGKYALAEQMCREVLELQSRAFQPEHPARLIALNTLADAIAEQGRAAEAETCYRELLMAQQKIMGKEHPHTLNTMNDLATVMADQGKYADAEKLTREVVDIRTRTLGKEHPDTLINISNLGQQIWSQGRLDEAESIFFDVSEIKKRVLGPDNPSTLVSLNNLAATFSGQFRFADAEKLYQEVLASRQRVLGIDHPNTLTTKNNLAVAIAAQGRHKDAEELYRQVLECRQRLIGPEHAHTLETLGALGAAVHKQGRHDEAEKLFRQVFDGRQRVLGPEHPHTLIGKRWLGISMLEQGRHSESEQILREVHDAQKRVQGLENPERLVTAQKLADAIAAQGRYDEAETLHRQTMEQQSRLLRQSNPALLATKGSLANDLLQLNRLEESESIARDVIEQLKKNSNADQLLFNKVANTLESSLKRQGRIDEAETVHRELLSNSQDD